MFNNLHDIQCTISQVTKGGLVTNECNIFGVKTTWFTAICLWHNLGKWYIELENVMCNIKNKYMLYLLLYYLKLSVMLHL